LSVLDLFLKYNPDFLCVISTICIVEIREGDCRIEVYGYSSEGPCPQLPPAVVNLRTLYKKNKKRLNVLNLNS